MTCTEEYREHIEYTFHAFCKVVIRNASYTALRTRSRKNKREISLDYLTDEKHYPLEALSRLPAQDREMVYLSFFKRLPQHEIGRRYGRSRSTAGYHIRKAIQQLYDETIVPATSGEPEAVNTVLQYYSRRIRYAALVNGQADKDVEEYITETLLKALFKFRFLDSPPLTTE